MNEYMSLNTVSSSVDDIEVEAVKLNSTRIEKDAKRFYRDLNPSLFK